MALTGRPGEQHGTNSIPSPSKPKELTASQLNKTPNSKDEAPRLKTTPSNVVLPDADYKVKLSDSDEEESHESDYITSSSSGSSDDDEE